MSKYYNHQGCDVLSLHKLREQIKQEQPSLLPWGVAHWNIAAWHRLNSRDELKYARSYREATESIFKNDDALGGNKPDGESPELLGTGEIATMLNVSQRTIQRLAKRGVLPTPVNGSPPKRPKWLKADILVLFPILEAKD